MELVDISDDSHRPIELSPQNSQPSDPPDGSPPSGRNVSLLTLVLCCTVAGGVQFGWALQLSLLTPYIQVT